MNGTDNTRRTLERVVTVAIALALIQYILEDAAVLAGWSWDTRRALLLAGLGLDFVFAVEFLTRLYGAFINRRTGVYFFHERGWIDLLASVPVVLLASGPAALAVWSGTAMTVGVSPALSIVTAVRVVRVLRILRVHKLLDRFPGTQSLMARRLAAGAASIAVSATVIGLLLLSLYQNVVAAPALEAGYDERMSAVLSLIHASEPSRAGGMAAVEELASDEPSVLLVQTGGRTVYSRLAQHSSGASIGPPDYRFSDTSGMRVFLDLRPINREHASGNLAAVGLIALLVFSFLVWYSPHVALTVSDPARSMSRGMAEERYNLAVRIPKLYREDEIYRLARLYNEVYLPLKVRNGKEDAADASI